jgi:hypothetical protein
MRKLIAALQVTVDGFIEGPNGELDRAMAGCHGYACVAMFPSMTRACVRGHEHGGLSTTTGGVT